MTLLVLHLVATAYMAGVLWTIQLVHYPLYAFAERARFGDMMREHIRRIAWTVMPAMFVEAGTGIALLVDPPQGVPRAWLIAGLALIAVAWISTLAVQGPLNARLLGGYDEVVHRRLVRTNWLRTIAWSVRAGLVAAMVLRLR